MIKSNIIVDVSGSQQTPHQSQVLIMTEAIVSS